MTTQISPEDLRYCPKHLTVPDTQFLSSTRDSLFPCLTGWSCGSLLDLLDLHPLPCSPFWCPQEATPHTASSRFAHCLPSSQVQPSLLLVDERGVKSGHNSPPSLHVNPWVGPLYSSPWNHMPAKASHSTGLTSLRETFPNPCQFSTKDGSSCHYCWSQSSIFVCAIC